VLRDALLLAVGTLSTLRLPPPRTVDRRVAGLAMVLAPVAVLPLGVLVAVVVLAGRETGLHPLATGLLAVGALALGTRALHWDGLSDVADGLTASYDRERSLAVMRTGTSGPAGTLAVVLVVGLQSVGFGALSLTVDAASGALLAGAAVLVSRCALATACARPVPSARPEGLGATVAGTVPVWAAVLSWVVGLSLLGLLLAVAGGDPLRAVVGLVLAVAVVVVLLVRCTRRLGGVTGDVLGAVVELSLAVLLLTLALD
jgi:adenosylcobinamide-GDP ribazoletransferase